MQIQTTLKHQEICALVLEIVARRLGWTTKRALASACLAHGVLNADFERVYFQLCKNELLDRRIRNLHFHFDWKPIASESLSVDETVTNVSIRIRNQSRWSTYPTEVVRATPLGAGLFGVDVPHELSTEEWNADLRLIAAYLHHLHSNAKAAGTWQLGKQRSKHISVLGAAMQLDGQPSGFAIWVPVVAKRQYLKGAIQRFEQRRINFEIW